MRSGPVKNDKEAYEFMRDHLKNQDQKAMDDEGSSCQYRTGDYGYPTLKCAVGSLISETYYEWNLEDSMIDKDGPVYTAVSKSNPDWDIDEDSVGMLLAMQRFHDEVNVGDWEWLFEVVEQAIEEFGFDKVMYRQGYFRSALYAMVSMTQHNLFSGDTRLREWNFSEVTLDWFKDKKEMAKA